MHHARFVVLITANIHGGAVAAVAYTKNQRKSFQQSRQQIQCQRLMRGSLLRADGTNVMMRDSRWEYHLKEFFKSNWKKTGHPQNALKEPNNDYSKRDYNSFQWPYTYGLYEKIMMMQMIMLCCYEWADQCVSTHPQLLLIIMLVMVTQNAQWWLLLSGYTMDETCFITRM